MAEVSFASKRPQPMETPLSKHDLNLSVAYPAASKPFKDHNASPSETLSSLKPRVLAYFGLTEGQQGENTVSYVFFEKKDRLTDLSVTLGSLAGNAGALALKLSQQLEQG